MANTKDFAALLASVKAKTQVTVSTKPQSDNAKFTTMVDGKTLSLTKGGYIPIYGLGRISFAPFQAVWIVEHAAEILEHVAKVADESVKRMATNRDAK